MSDLDKFTTAFIASLYFTDTGPDTEIDADLPMDDDAMLDMMADCRSFWRRYGVYVMAEDGQIDAAAKAGHDFWLTRNGHGAGFWDGDWERYGEMLDKGATSYGPVYTYENDGKIYA